MMLGIHGAEEVGGGFMFGFILLVAPMAEQTVAQASKRAHDPHGLGLADPAEVFEMGNIQALMEAAFDAPGGAIELEPLGGVQLGRGQAGDERHHFRGMVAELTPH